eukprot:CAMPEP_0194319166 /NCGR_PEP_ID=MMETSP0171-20130528/15644_1 /TAXON_ID=218684 /ORGANISM="Corethron pennatum, Strain L29A3" /LENGTH=900 /DNA_ID=CAMNT_0039076285 /DNA_START=122 /DNA_END=2825 /DNA_ORIENTATION=+
MAPEHRSLHRLSAPGGSGSPVPPDSALLWEFDVPSGDDEPDPEIWFGAPHVRLEELSPRSKLAVSRLYGRPEKGAPAPRPPVGMSKRPAPRRSLPAAKRAASTTTPGARGPKRVAVSAAGRSPVPAVRSVSASRQKAAAVPRTTTVARGAKKLVGSLPARPVPRTGVRPLATKVTPRTRPVTTPKANSKVTSKASVEARPKANSKAATKAAPKTTIAKRSRSPRKNAIAAARRKSITTSSIYPTKKKATVRRSRRSIGGAFEENKTDDEKGNDASNEKENGSTAADASAGNEMASFIKTKTRLSLSSSGSRSRNLLVEQEKGTLRRSRRSIGGASEENNTDSEKENDATVGKDNELKTVLSVKKASRLSLSSSKSRCRNPLGEIRGFGNGTCLDRRREETNDAVKLMESKLKTTCAVETADLPGDGDWAGGHCPNDNAEITDLRSQVSKAEMLFVVANATNLRLEREVADLAEVLRAEKEARGAAEKETVRIREEAFAYSRRVEELEAELGQCRSEGRAMLNTIQELRGNVRVFARIRPFLPGDGGTPENDGPLGPACVFPETNACLKIMKANGTEQSFTFDRVFSPSASQGDVFNEISELVQSALDGYNVCLFSYGQTGSGKTHTLQGSMDGELRGIIPRSIAKIAQYKESLEKCGWKYDVKVSFLEIYNESIRDLLRDQDVEETKHEIKVNVDGSRSVTNLTIAALDPTDELAVQRVLRRAESRRTVACTDMNATSSRSHAVFTLHFVAVNTEQRQTLRGALNLVDLAGSERLSRSGAEGIRAKEAAAINKSLSSLSDVFVAISQQANHVPFRNSKLTHLLQPCLGGDGKMLLLVNLSPTEESHNESLCSLRFASLVGQCELGKAKRTIERMNEDASVDDGFGLLMNGWGDGGHELGR